MMRRRTRLFRPTTEADTARIVDCACGEAKARQFACRPPSLAPFPRRLPRLHIVALAFFVPAKYRSPAAGTGIVLADMTAQAGAELAVTKSGGAATHGQRR